jgi:hypothetical protein
MQIRSFQGSGESAWVNAPPTKVRLFVWDPIRAAAAYVDLVLKGARPGELPVQVPVKFELAINLYAAKGLGLNIPSTLIGTCRRGHRIELLFAAVHESVHDPLNEPALAGGCWRRGRARCIYHRNHLNERR